MSNLKTHFVELLRRASTQLPPDVTAALKAGYQREPPGTAAQTALATILKNIKLSRKNSTPLCQDTGTNIWHVYHPQNICQCELEQAIREATLEARNRAYLRPNAVDPITGLNTGTNLGIRFPVISFYGWKKQSVRASVMLKGGGCENVSAQYALPVAGLHAGRDLDGVRKVVLDAVFQAQGKGCAPGIVGVGIGGDRITGMIEAKHQLWRPLEDKNPNALLAKLENRLYRECNQLEIGPMGYGGKTTVLGVKAGSIHRVPASYFVSISYMCWASRRASVTITPTGNPTFHKQVPSSQECNTPNCKG
ncbi:MAG: fumarate hydratase [Deltaproteobacteria bacterium]|nr:fumarate hydratase [Deltaproteobacteria bacterium]MBN2671739.1 fumarate hydratase [Deltaproteobacteria bacterium]